MKIILERHTYAPELNKAYVGPSRVMIPAPGCASIADVRKRLFAPLQYRGRHVVLHAQNEAGREAYNYTRSGFCNDMRSLKGALIIFRQQHNLPGCEHLIKTRLIG